MSENHDLPGIQGPGVAPFKSKKIDAAIRIYFPAKERRIEALKEEVDAKKNLMELLHQHEKEIGKDDEGVIRYKFDAKVIGIKPSEEKLFIADDPDPE